MTRKPNEVEACLQQKFGFTPDKQREKGHRRYVLRLPGLLPIRTYFSHGKDEIRDKLWGRIAKELHVRVPFFDGMIECSNSKDDYYKQVRNDPYPPFPNYPGSK